MIKEEEMEATPNQMTTNSFGHVRRQLHIGCFGMPRRTYSVMSVRGSPAHEISKSSSELIAMGDYSGGKLYNLAS